MFIRTAGILLTLGFVAGCGSSGASLSTSDGTGTGTPPPPPGPLSLFVSSVKIAGTTNVASTVTINGQSDQNSAATAWARTSTPNATTLANGYEQTVIATTAGGSATLVVTLTVDD